VGSELIRIVSDIHYADRVTRVRSLEQLRPLLDGVSSFVLNGDTVDTRPDANPGRTAQNRRQVLDFFGSAGTEVRFMTGNHDPDLSSLHELQLAGGRVLVTHGDILFDNIVPWSRDANMMHQKILAAFAAEPPGAPRDLESRMRIFRAVAASIPQRHQSEPNLLRYAVRFACDTVWPPNKAFTILRAWREAPGRAADLARTHRPKAGFVVMGHTHRPGVWKTPSGVTVVNTGSFCRPFGALVAEVRPGFLAVRRVEIRNGDFHAGPTVAEHSLS
jgi:predicted phosphodiesterase